MSNQPTCPDCGQAMELGFIPDASYTGAFQTHWHQGTPEDRSFLGLKIPAGMGSDITLIKTDSSEMKPVKTFRCPGCGVLKFYAT